MRAAMAEATAVSAVIGGVPVAPPPVQPLLPVDPGLVIDCCLIVDEDDTKIY